jgi:hypothetical protein
MAGVIENGAGRPLTGVTVSVCSASHFANLERDGCMFSAVATTGPDGRFAFDHQGAWEWFNLLPHEAPLPYTLVSACTRDGRMGGVKLDPAHEGSDLHVPVAPPEALKLIEAGPQFTGPADAADYVRRSCNRS